MIPVAQIVRVSTEEQAADGRAGLARQTYACGVAVARYGLHVVASYSLVDVSGSRVAETSEWREVAAMLQAGTIRGVVVDALDRLVRATDFDLRVLMDLTRHRARIWTEQGPRDPSSPDDQLLLGIQAMMGGREKSEIQRRAREGKEAKRRKGEWVNPRRWLPAGVDYDRTAPEGQRWRYTDAVRDVVALFDRYARGDISVHALALQTGVGHRGMRLRLSNQLYSGWLVYDQRNAGEPYKATNGRQATRRRVERAPHEVIRVRVLDPPAVDDATFQRVQDLLGSRQTTYRPRGRPDGVEPWPLRGMLRCAGCGSYVDNHAGSRANYYRYACASMRGGVHATGVECDAGSMSTTRTRDAVVAALVAHLSTPATIEALLLTMLDDEAADEARERLRDAERRLADAKRKMGRILGLYLDAQWTAEQLAPQKTALDGQIAALERELAQMRRAANVQAPDVGALASTLARAVLALRHADGADLRDMLQPLRPTFWVYKPKGNQARPVVQRMDLDLANLDAGAAQALGIVHVAVCAE